jgi:hypothetical protein
MLLRRLGSDSLKLSCKQTGYPMMFGNTQGYYISNKQHDNDFIESFYKANILVKAPVSGYEHAYEQMQNTNLVRLLGLEAMTKSSSVCMAEIYMQILETYTPLQIVEGKEEREEELKIQNMFLAFTFRILFHCFVSELLPQDTMTDRIEWFLVMASVFSRRYRIYVWDSSKGSNLLTKCLKHCGFTSMG